VDIDPERETEQNDGAGKSEHGTFDGHLIFSGMVVGGTGGLQREHGHACAEDERKQHQVEHWSDGGHVLYSKLLSVDRMCWWYIY
jgi:hypothetical protein